MRIKDVVKSARARVAGAVALAMTSPFVVNASVALAAGSSNCVQYGSSNSGVANTISTSMEGLAATIRDILGATALVALVAAALVNHFVHDQRAKDRAKEIAGAAVVGLLIAGFAPAIVNWFTGIGNSAAPGC
jgi:hypothetical protein